MAGGNQWDPTYRYATSWLLSPWKFFTYRALICLFIVASRIYYSIFFATGRYTGAAQETTHQFSQFTGLTNWGQAFYFFFAAMHTWSYARYGRPFLASWPRALQVAHEGFYATILVFPVVVTAVYWSILFDASGPESDIAADVCCGVSSARLYIQIAQHALNSAWVVTEIILPRTRALPWYHIATVLVFGAMYLGVAYVTVHTQHYYVYAFLNPASVGGTGIVAAYCVGLLVGAAIIFGIVCGLLALRRWLTEEKLGMRGKLSPRHAGWDGPEGGRDPEMGGPGKSTAW